MKKRDQSPISIMWFKQDLRIKDNPALLEAAQLGPVLAIYIFDNSAPKEFKIGSVSKIWLHHSLLKLNESIQDNLNIYEGNTENIIEQLLHVYAIQHVFWNKNYEPWHRMQEQKIELLLKQQHIPYTAFNSNYLWHPEDVIKEDGTYYKVFTAYKNKARSLTPPAPPLAAPQKAYYIKDKKNPTTIDKLMLIPTQHWPEKILRAWDIGEKAAHSKLQVFLKHRLSEYKIERDFPAKAHSSLLSPHLHFGEISPAHIWQAINQNGPSYAASTDIDHFLSELIWREFSVYLLYHFKKMHTDNFKSSFNTFPWDTHHSTNFKKWQQGKTGFPLIDAGMRQLWETGYMHNRVRMVVASFLIKNLNIHWRTGQAWFWDCLVDADLASNSFNWQWVAGCGADAAPYFRIFNPSLQSQKFDPQGTYIRYWVPELKNVPTRWIHEPSKASQSLGIHLGRDYPLPMVDYSQTRKLALSLLKSKPLGEF